LPTFQSIEALERGNIIDTQNRPIIIHASDLNFYYCKYHNLVGAAHRLFKEMLIASFLDSWQFNHAPVALIREKSLKYLKIVFLIMPFQLPIFLI